MDNSHFIIYLDASTDIYCIPVFCFPGYLPNENTPEKEEQRFSPVSNRTEKEEQRFSPVSNRTVGEVSQLSPCFSIFSDQNFAQVLAK